MPFSNEQQRDMMQIYYACNRNVKNTSAAYLQTYPERRQPNETYFLKLHRNLSEHECFHKKRTSYGSRALQVNRDAIVQVVVCCPSFVSFFNTGIIIFISG